MKIILLSIMLLTVFFLFLPIAFSEPIYETVKSLLPVYKEITINIPLESFANGTTFKKYSYKKLIIDSYTLKDVETENRIGFMVGTTPFYGFNNYHDNVFATWKNPVGKRNFIEFPLCREYEKEKGVCDERII